MRNTRLVLSTQLAVLLLCHVSHVAAYETETHKDLSQQATVKSSMKLPTMLLDIGLKGLTLDDASQQFPNSKGDRKSILNLVRDGAEFEDTLATSNLLTSRPFNHFFNPRTGQGLIFGGVQAGLPSPDWVLASPGSVSDQLFSFFDARRYFYEALTQSSKNKRVGFPRFPGHYPKPLQAFSNSSGLT